MVHAFTTSGAFLMLLDVIATFALVVAVSSVAGRLLGLRRTWRVIVLTGIVGWTLGSGLAFLINGVDATGWASIAEQVIFGVIFTMLAQVALELLKRPDLHKRQTTQTGLPHPFRALRASTRRGHRYTEIVAIAMRNGLGAHIGRRRQHADGMTDERLLGHRLRATLEEAGGMFVKLGQVLSTRSDLLPRDVVAELADLQNNVQAAPHASVRALVEHEIDRPFDSVFSDFNWEPIAAASIAQVHAATLMDGRNVVVKVQRPGIEELVEHDLDALRRLVETIERRARWARSYHLPELVSEFADRLHDELDFRIEAANMAEIAQTIDGVNLHVPVVHPELVTRRLLTMEKLDGTSIGDAKALTRREVDVSALADMLLASYLQQVLVDGVYHADPHPGNILYLEDGRLGLIDFGAVGRLDATQQEALTAMLLAMSQRDPEALLAASLDAVVVPANVDLNRLQHALAGYLARHLNPARNPSGEAFIALLKLLTNFGVVVPAELSTLFRTLATLQGTIESLSPGYLFTARAETIAVQVLGGTGESAAPSTNIAKAAFARDLQHLRRLPRRLDRITTLTERGDLRLRVSLFSTDTDVRSVTTLVNRLILAGLGVGLAIAGALLLGADDWPCALPATRLLDTLRLFHIHLPRCGIRHAQ
jgi:ubiquinone biosynthesis protein